MSKKTTMLSYEPKKIVPLEEIDREFMSVAVPRVAQIYRCMRHPDYRVAAREAFGFPYSALVPAPVVVEELLSWKRPKEIARLMIAWKKSVGSCFSGAVPCDITKRPGQLFEAIVPRISDLPSTSRDIVDLCYAELVSSSG